MIAEDIMAGNEIVSSDESNTFFEPLQDMFSTVDTDSSGDVSVNELVEGLMRQGYTLTESEVEQLVTRMDVNRDGRIEFDEFATCLLDWQEFKGGERWKKLVDRAFKKLDLNGDGYISLEELIALLPAAFKTEEEKRAAVRCSANHLQPQTHSCILLVALPTNPLLVPSGLHPNPRFSFFFGVQLNDPCSCSLCWSGGATAAALPAVPNA
mmetsp:Transcript_13912/g.32850  ORF Transcript_13912/g.32850 Transcript_13912/m.32850 type:complete len:210 (-) Transcript_13912:587-1216(-)